MRTRRAIAIAIVAVATVAGTVAFTGIVAADGERFRATLLGANEIPGPGDPDGSAKGRVEIDLETNEVCFRFQWKNIATPVAGHIHIGDVTESGPIVVGLLDDISPDVLEAKDHVSGCVTGDPAILADIVADPDQYYLNLHTLPRFPLGAVRGQLEAR